MPMRRGITTEAARPMALARWRQLQLALLVLLPASATYGRSSAAQLKFLNSGEVKRTETFETVGIHRIGGVASGICMESYAYRPAMGATNMASANYGTPSTGTYQYLYHCSISAAMVRTRLERTTGAVTAATSRGMTTSPWRRALR